MAKTIFAQLPAELQTALATNAGIILKTFDPNMSLAEPTTAAQTIKENILFATSGGVSTTCVAEFEDWGEDVDNCPKNTKELLNLKKWECKMSGTALTVTQEAGVSMFGAADASGSDVITVKPRMELMDKDFKDLWYVCPYGTEGGFVAVKLGNALSTGGFSMQSTDEQKGQFAFEYTGYSSLEAPEVVPFEFYIRAKSSAPAMASNLKA